MNKIIITTKNGNNIIAKSKDNPFVKFSNVGYSFILRNKENEFLNKFYHGENGIILGSEKCKEISRLKKQYSNDYLHDLLGANIQVLKIDGRTKESKNLPYYRIDMLL